MIELVPFIIISLIFSFFTIYHVIHVTKLNDYILELAKLQKARDLTDYTIASKDTEEVDHAVIEYLNETVPLADADEAVFNKHIKDALEGTDG